MTDWKDLEVILGDGNSQEVYFYGVKERKTLSLNFYHVNKQAIVLRMF